MRIQHLRATGETEASRVACVVPTPAIPSVKQTQLPLGFILLQAFVAVRYSSRVSAPLLPRAARWEITWVFCKVLNLTAWSGLRLFSLWLCVYLCTWHAWSMEPTASGFSSPVAEGLQGRAAVRSKCFCLLSPASLKLLLVCWFICFCHCIIHARDAYSVCASLC